jgi:hypothetical protein
MTAKIKKYKKPSHHTTKPKGIRSREFEKVHWPYLPILLVIFVLLSFTIQSGTLGAITRHPTGRVLDYATSMTISGLLADTNTARTSNGVGALSLNAKLDAAAQAKANDMAARNYWSHNTPEGNPPWTFVTAQGYAYQKLGENLAAGFSDEQATINGWMASPPHKENLLDTAFKDVGFGFANNPNYTSAGGGPMTIVVAFYGKSASSTAPVTPAPPPAAPTAKNTSKIPTSTPPPAPTASTQPPAPAPQPIAQPSQNPNTDTLTNGTPKKAEPTTTENKPQGVTLSLRTSRAQVAFARLPISSFATGLATFGVFAAAGFWISRHLLMLRRVFVYGESFVIKHPMIDVGLVVIAALSYVLSQTAGIIQ